jgi:tetratricopeptide (TPR) repeat protein
LITGRPPRAVGRATGLVRLSRILLFLAGVTGAAPARAASTSPDLLEAAEVARRAAADVAESPSPRLFVEALDADGILLRRIGPEAWDALTPRQREVLRAGIRERFVRSLAPPHSGSSGVAWTGAQATPFGVDVFLGLRFDSRVLKTRWAMRRVGGGWRIADVVLSDPGVSLARAAETALGPKPVERRTRGTEVWATAAPRVGAIAVLAIAAAAIAFRLPRAKRPLVYLTAAAPIALFGIDGALAVHRSMSEAYVLQGRGAPEPWRAFEQLAITAEREGRGTEARDYWAKALAAGGPAGPIEYQIGLEARQHGDVERARAEFERSLGEAQPAPGAGRELAFLNAAAGKFAEAEPLLVRYIAAAGPDPESLSLLSVVQTNLGKSAGAVASIARARDLVGDAWRSDEIEARVRARAGDGPGCVAALRAMEGRGTRVDRSVLRADPAYLPIATDPAWVAFLNERTTRQ